MFPPSHIRSRGFTLIELLIVIRIMVLLTPLVVPASNKIKPAGDVAGAAYTIKAVLIQARSYAMANNTYTDRTRNRCPSRRHSIAITTTRKTKCYGWIHDTPDQRDFLYAPPAFLRALPLKVDLRARNTDIGSFSGMWPGEQFTLELGQHGFRVNQPLRKNDAASADYRPWIINRSA